jgi:hypothetical protein
MISTVLPSGAACAIVHHHGLAQALAQWLGQQPRQHIRQAAGGEGDDEAQWPVGPGLREGRHGQRKRGRGQQGAAPKRRAKQHVSSCTCNQAFVYANSVWFCERQRQALR